MNDIRKACVRAVFDDFDDHGDAIRPAVGEEWDGIDANRPLGHIIGCVDLDVDGSHELASIGKDQARTFIQKSEAQGRTTIVASRTGSKREGRTTRSGV